MFQLLRLSCARSSPRSLTAGSSTDSRRGNARRISPRATIYLPTRRATRLARDVFLDVLNSEAAILPRLVALGDIDEDELIFAQAASNAARARSCRRPSTGSNGA